ncbi:MAG TPA: hypothetical protein VFL94_06760 [Actinomycetales bacterium]|nr:hypothetical protein [Actinomycetales bacterium]
MSGLREQWVPPQDESRTGRAYVLGVVAAVVADLLALGVLLLVVGVVGLGIAGTDGVSDASGGRRAVILVLGALALTGSTLAGGWMATWTMLRRGVEAEPARRSAVVAVTVLGVVMLLADGLTGKTPLQWVFGVLGVAGGALAADRLAPRSVERALR